MNIAEKICVGFTLLIVCWIFFVLIRIAITDKKKPRLKKPFKLNPEYWIYHGIINGFIALVFLVCLFLYDKNILSWFGFAVILGGTILLGTKEKMDYDRDNP